MRELHSKSLANTVPDGLYRVTAYGVEYSLTGTGRPMYTVTLLIDEGEWADMMVKWRLVETPEWPKLLRKYFQGLNLLGVDLMAYAASHSHEDVIRAIVDKGATLDIVLRTGADGWQNVQDARLAL